LYNLYNFATQFEYGCSIIESTRNTNLQDKMVEAAKLAEIQERPVVQGSQLLSEQRQEHIAIKSKREVQLSTILFKLPEKKLQEYEDFPFTAQLGFIHAIPEDTFDIATATVVDVCFLGIMPKTIFEAMRKYGHNIDSHKTSETYQEFQALVDKLIYAIVYCPVTIQKTIHILIAKHRLTLDELDQDHVIATPAHDNTNNLISEDTPPLTAAKTETETCPSIEESKRNVCHAIKCRILYAKGIIRRPMMLCSTGRNICSGCTIEAAKQKKAKQLEREVLLLNGKKSELAPLLDHRTKPCSVKDFRKLLCMLPSFQKKTRDDHMFGAARYLATSLGILLHDSSSCLLDEHMTSKEVRQLWSKATSYCKCKTSYPINYDDRFFCLTCSYLISVFDTDVVVLCPSCQKEESWQYEGHPCLACQYASCVYQNPYERRLENIINTWLPIASDFGSNSEDDASISHDNMACRHISTCNAHCNPSLSDILKLRQSSIDDTLDEIRANSTSEQNKNVFRDLTLLQRSLQHLDQTQLQSDDHRSSDIGRNKENSLKKSEEHMRIALAPLDQNISNCNNNKRSPTNIGSHVNPPADSKNKKPKETKWTKGSSKQVRNHLRTLRKKGLV
jgi:hypothetical protein